MYNLYLNYLIEYTLLPQSFSTLSKLLIILFCIILYMS